MSTPKIQKSTKITVIICACFLLLTAAVLVFLMFFPYKPEQEVIVQHIAPETTQNVQTEAVMLPEDGQYTEAPHTLSTWSASIEGHSHSPQEYWEYMLSTTTYESVFTEQPEFYESSEGEFTETTPESEMETEISAEYTTSFDEEADTSEMENSEFIQSETETETVVIPPETDPQPTEYIPPTDPPVIDIPAEPTAEEELPV